MIIDVIVSPRSSRLRVVQVNNEGGAGHAPLKIYLTRPACDGEANRQLVDLLADYFNTSKSRIRILKGQKGRKKIVEITQ